MVAKKSAKSTRTSAKVGKHPHKAEGARASRPKKRAAAKRPKRKSSRTR